MVIHNYVLVGPSAAQGPSWMSSSQGLLFCALYEAFPTATYGLHPFLLVPLPGPSWVINLPTIIITVPIIALLYHN